ncbi:MAG: DUF1345 domain-containing protein [Alphaproteobacteria bacterium]|nr:DUF1345 domain-containing protein [Alphaproteobacteria bacterium]
MPRRIPILSHLHVRPRLAISIVVGLLLLLILPHDWQQTTRMLVAWDIGIALYLTLAALMMARSNIESIRRRAALEDEGRIVILLLTTGAALASLVAIVVELSNARMLETSLRIEHMGLAGLTVILSWTFMQTMFALHYAHEFHTVEEEIHAGGLEFPGHEAPDYWDFVYYSFIIGTAVATADVNVTSRPMRRITTLHCVVAFFFNTMILALTVNIGAGLF